MMLSDLKATRQLSEELFDHIVNHYNLPYMTKVVSMDLSRTRWVHTIDDIKLNNFIDEIPPMVTVNTKTYGLSVDTFASHFNERVKCAYLAEMDTLYIDIIQPFNPHVFDRYQRQYIPPQPPKPLVWHKNSNESIFVYGDRMFKTHKNGAYIDNPYKRRVYQVTVLKSIMNLFKR